MSTHYRVTTEGDWTIVALGGVLDFDRAPGLRDLLMGCVAKASRIKVDLSRVEKIDTAGLASLVEAYRTATRNGGRFRLTGVGQAVRKVLHLAGLDALFPSK